MAKTATTNNDLKKQLSEQREALRASRFGGGTAKSTNVKLGRELRRGIARLLTKIHAERN